MNQAANLPDLLWAVLLRCKCWCKTCAGITAWATHSEHCCCLLNQHTVPHSLQLLYM
jgi:hypothetical protein